MKSTSATITKGAKKRSSVRLVIFSLFSLLILSSFAGAQRASLPGDPRFDQPVGFSTAAEGESLRAMVTALAKSVGLTAVADSVPDTMITYDIGEPKPFRQVWDLVTTLNDLDYLLMENDVVVVGTPASVAKLEQQNPTEADEGGERVQRFYRVVENPEDLAEVVRQAVPGVSVDVLANLNTLSVRALEEEQSEVERVLSRFNPEIAQPVRRVYPLSNADAAVLAETLTETIISGERETTNLIDNDNDQATDEQTTVNTVVRTEDIVIAADERTNSVIVTAPETVQAEIAALIEVLDIPQPQVNVQVRIQEIQTRSAANLGINLSAGVGNFATTLLNSGLQFVFDAQNAVSGLNINAVLDTLETQGLSRRVDDSNLTMLNNSPGKINVGGRIELTFASLNGDIQTRTLEYGVIIEVTPRISADGRVILEISAEVSDLAVPLSEGGIPQRIDFTTREVTSTVTLAPGQTVLLGGLLQNALSTTRSKTPVLGSIPIIGSLFSTTNTEEEDTELLLIVSAMVIE